MCSCIHYGLFFLLFKSLEYYTSIDSNTENGYYIFLFITVLRDYANRCKLLIYIYFRIFNGYYLFKWKMVKSSIHCLHVLHVLWHCILALVLNQPNSISDSLVVTWLCIIDSLPSLHRFH